MLNEPPLQGINIIITCLNAFDCEGFAFVVFLFSFVSSIQGVSGVAGCHAFLLTQQFESSGIGVVVMEIELLTNGGLSKTEW